MGKATCEKRNNTITRENIKAATKPYFENGKLMRHGMGASEMLRHFGIVTVYVVNGEYRYVQNERKMARFNLLRK